MFLAFVSGLGPDRIETDLCLVPDKPDIMTVPMRIRDIVPETAASYRIGAEEAVCAMIDPADGALVIAALNPGSIYLTPNLMVSPGFKVRKIKVVIEGERYRTFYERERAGWEEWVANKERT